MIKVNELRIGSWVCLVNRMGKVHFPETETIFKIVTLGVFETELVLINENPAQKAKWAKVHYKDLSPIPLTPDLVEACGLKNTGNFFTQIFRKKDVLISQILGVPHEFTFGYYREAGRVGTTAVAFEYLHQLQNLYLALTGDELELMLNSEPEVQVSDTRDDDSKSEPR